MSTQIYIEGQRLELFKDETIQIKSSQQNISDLDTVRTDFSQTFTVPASSNNNRIFQHFYQSDIDSTIDHNIRRNAVIEVDLNTFRKGFIQLEKSNLKDGQPESYSLTFYGDVIAIKDKFKEDLLSDISELTNASFSYTQANVLSEIQDDTITDIKFPLIVNRQLTYGDGQTTDISHTGTGAIHTNELFPAINMKTLFDTIESRYGLTFNGSFLDSDRFKKAYLYCKNAQDFQFITKQEDVPLSTLSVSSLSNQNLTLTDYYNNGELTLQNQDAYTVLPTQSTYNYMTHSVRAKIDNLSDTDTKWYLDIFRNGVLESTITGTGNSASYQDASQDYDNFSMNPQVFTFKLRTDRVATAEVHILYLQKGYQNAGTFSNQIFAIDNVTTTSAMDVISYLPKMKVLDFFKGVLNMFNLTCYNVGENTFQVETLDNWYSKGGIVDITQHVDIKSIGVNRVPLYKNIEMKYKPSKSANNEAFNSLFKKQFGDAKNEFNYEGGDYKIQLPFENLMMNTFRDEGSDLQVGLTIDSAGSKYVPQPMILYMSTYLNADFNVNDTNAHYNLTGYVPFGQDLKVDGVDYSLNFSADNSTLLGKPIQQSLFATYYYAYLNNLYNLKNRNVTLKAKFPTSLLTSLELNDRLIIRDKRYTINEMTTDVTSGEVTLDLLHDLRPTLAESNIPLVPIIKPDTSSQCLSIDILFPKNAIQADITDVIGNLTSVTPSTLTSEGSIVVCIPEVVGDNGELITEDSLFTIALEDGSGNDYLLEEGDGETSANYVLQVLYTYSNGDTSTSFIYLTQGDTDDEATSTAPNPNA